MPLKFQSSRSNARALAMGLAGGHPWDRPSSWSLAARRGRLLARGMLAARRRPGAKPSELQQAATMIEALGASSLPLTIDVRANVLVRCTLDGVDVTALLKRLSGGSGRITEVSFGCNAAVRPSVDWGVNSLMNEGVRGLHLGIGDGIRGLHIDFVCPER